MSRKKVSVIIPVYNVENYLERAIESVVNQTLKDIEIILVDDGSEDRSPEICDEYELRYPNIIKVLHKKNEGLGFARNSGVEIASGDYIAFIDSDDSVESTMYEEMYNKAIEGDFDIVMCDVKIIWVEEEKETIIRTFGENEIDMGTYLISGNNITYSVNKLYKKSIWMENKYEKMLFEDIALIPALVIKYSNIGYVSKPFYNYYRRSNTISTTIIGQMVDIVDAFRKFIDNSESKYRDEVVYCVAKQLMWNMTKSRVEFQADFIDFLKEYKSDFMINSYIENDKDIKSLLKFVEVDLIQNNIICPNFKNEISEVVLDDIKCNFPTANIILVEQDFLFNNELPVTIREAWSQGKIDYVEEYCTLVMLYNNGGIVLSNNVIANLRLRKLRLNKMFFGFKNREEINTECYGAMCEHYILKKLIESYKEESIYNKAFLPLKERLRDYLIINFGLKTTGKKQLLKNEIQIFMPNILSYDMKDGNNCCKLRFDNVLEGFEMVDNSVLELWSNEIMNNWNLYKSLRDKNDNVKKTTKINSKTENKQIATNNQSSKQVIDFSSREFQEYVQQREKRIVDIYENSTSWKLTKPVRKIKDLFKCK